MRVLDSRTDGDAVILDLQITSSRDAPVVTVHTDRPVDDVAIAAGGHPPVTSTPTYADGAESPTWPYELRFYDLSPDGIRVTVRLPGSEPPRISLSDYTVGLEQVPGFTARARTSGPVARPQLGPRRRWPHLQPLIAQRDGRRRGVGRWTRTVPVPRPMRPPVPHLASR